MNLYLLRHGVAEPCSPALMPLDHRRPLTAEGVQKIKRTARAMRKMGLRFDRILASPHVRAKATAEIVAGAFKARTRVVTAAALAPGGDPDALLKHLARLRPSPENVLLVGHEPDLGHLAARLCADGALRLKLKKGGLCLLSTDGSGLKGGAVLEWLLTPKQMAAMT